MKNTQSLLNTYAYRCGYGLQSLKSILWEAQRERPNLERIIALATDAVAEMEKAAPVVVIEEPAEADAIPDGTRTTKGGLVR